MKNKKYFFSRYPTSYLLAFLDQKEKEALRLKTKYLENNDVKLFRRIKYLEVLIMLMKATVTERYLEENMSLTKCGCLLLKSRRSKREILKDVFTTKLINGNDLIEVELLEKVISELNIDNLQQIIDSNKEDISVMYAKLRFDELLFEVDEEVKLELKQKLLSDGGIR